MKLVKQAKVDEKKKMKGRKAHHFSPLNESNPFLPKWRHLEAFCVWDFFEVVEEGAGNQDISPYFIINSKNERPHLLNAQ